MYDNDLKITLFHIHLQKSWLLNNGIQQPDCMFNVKLKFFVKGGNNIMYTYTIEVHKANVYIILLLIKTLLM